MWVYVENVGNIYSEGENETNKPEAMGMISYLAKGNNDIRNTPIITVTHPIIEIGLRGSLKISQENSTTATYPKLTIGYAILSLTRERAISQDNALIPKTKSPNRTNGFNNAVSSFNGASPGLDILPTFVIPSFSSI